MPLHELSGGRWLGLELFGQLKEDGVTREERPFSFAPRDVDGQLGIERAAEELKEPMQNLCCRDIWLEYGSSRDRGVLLSRLEAGASVVREDGVLIIDVEASLELERKSLSILEERKQALMLHISDEHEAKGVVVEVVPLVLRDLAVPELEHLGHLLEPLVQFAVLQEQHRVQDLRLPVDEDVDAHAVVAILKVEDPSCADLEWHSVLKLESVRAVPGSEQSHDLE